MLNVRMPPDQQGSSLIEVLVAIIVLSVGMLAMLWTVTKSMGFQQTAEFRNMATQFALDYADRARANAAAYTNYAYTQPYRPGEAIAAASKDCSANNIVCTGREMADYDKASMRQQLRTVLPSGDLFVQSENDRRLNIWILWQQPHMLGSEDQANAGSTALSTTSQCPAGAGRLEATTQCQFLGVRL